MTTTRRMPAVLAWCLVAWGCAEGENDAASAAAGSSGTATVAYSLDPADVPRGALVEELRLDAAAEDFSVVRTLSVGPDGTIAVPLRQDGQVWVYDASGERVGVFGRPGQGPGEFVSVGSTGFLPDTLWASDARTSRMTYFALDGSGLRSWTPQTFSVVPTGDGPARDMPPPMFNVAAVRADRRMVGSGRLMEPGGSRVSGTHVVVVTPGGEARIVATPPPFEDPRWYIEVEGLGWPMPFAMRPMGDVSADGTLYASLWGDVASEAALTLTVVRAGGDTVFSRKYPFPAEPVSAAARDSAVAALAPEGTPMEGPPDLYQRRQAIAREEMPEIHPPVERMRLGLDGTIWIDLRETAEGGVTLILDDEGAPIGSVPVPEGAVIQQASRERVWVTETDEVGLVSVVRYRVEGLAGG